MLWRGVLTVHQVRFSLSLPHSHSLLRLSVYNKLVVTTLRYTPVVLEHHVPYKTLPNGKLWVFLHHSSWQF